MPTLDPVTNFGKVTVSAGYDAVATSIVLQSGHGALLPAPATDGAFNLVWWNLSDNSDPADDANKEIVRCTARSTDTLTVTRAQEGTSATVKNVGTVYKMILTPTKKLRDNLETAVNEKGEGHITIDPWQYSSVIAGTWGPIYLGASTQYPGDWAIRNSSSTNLDQVDYKVYLAPGTYTFQIIYVRNTDRGIIDLLIDGNSAGTIDAYQSPLTYNVRTAVAGIVISAGGIKTLSLKVNGKNASSTSYLIDVSAMAMWRTA